MNKNVLNANQLKIIAIIAMTIDHAADLLYPGFPSEPVPVVMHLIGRLTAPIMWFFVCEGFYYTHHVKKYIGRLGIFAIISHFAYCFSFGISPIPFKEGLFNQTSVMYPLFIAAIVLWLENGDIKLNIWTRRILIFVLALSAFPADWSCIAVLAISDMYKYRGNWKKQFTVMLPYVAVYGIIAYLFVSKVYALELIGVVFVYPVVSLYNGAKGNANWMKWFFYLYYPAHLAIIGLIRIFAYGNVKLLF